MEQGRQTIFKDEIDYYDSIPDVSGYHRYFVSSSSSKRQKNCVTKEEIAEIITHNAFYAGWTKAWAPFGEGRGGIFNLPELKEIGDRYHKTPAQVILRWHIQRGIVMIPKSVHIERMKENFNVFDFELSEEDMNIINSLDKNNSSFFSNQDPNMVEWFVKMIEERKNR